MTFELTQFNQIAMVILGAATVFISIFVAIRAGFMAEKKHDAKINELFAGTKTDFQKEIRKTVDYHEKHCPHVTGIEVLKTKVEGLDEKMTTGFGDIKASQKTLSELINKLLKINGSEE